MKNLKTKLFALAMAAPMAVSAAGTAVFADEVDQTSATKIKIKKTLTTPIGQTKPTEDYTFVGAFQNVNGDTTYKEDNYTATVDADDFAKSENEGTWTYTATVDTNTITYTHEGVYEYTFTETPGTTAGMTYASESYTVQVYVVKDGGDYKVEKILAGKKDEENGKVAVTGDAVVLDFTNDFKDNTPIENVQGVQVTNHVVGEYGDKTKQFKYELTIDAAEGVTPDVKKGETPIEFKDGKYSFTLADGESVTISNIPVGTSYRVEQTDDATGYTTKTENKTAGAPEGYAPEMGDTYFDGYNTSVLDDLHFTNTATDVTPTGNFINNMPFIALIAVALGGFVAYIAAKRRNA